MQAYNFKRKNMKLRLLLLTFLLALFSINESNAQLLQWNTFGNTGLELTEPSVSNDPNVLISNLILGPGVTSAANANRFGGNNWWNTGNTSPSTLAEAVAGNDYIQFTVSPNIGFSFTATSFVFNWDKSGSGPQNVALRSSNDGYSVNLGSVVPTAAIGTQNTITISGLVNVTVATTFRLYGYGATGTTGTGGFDIGSNVINVILNGSTSPTAPQPEINLQGNAISIVSGDVTPSLADHTDFGTTPTTGGTIIRTFTIQNTGTLILNVGAITFSGANAADFIVTTPPSATVVASGSTTFQVTFDPSADGLRNAVISIVNNDSDENPYTFAIRGNGISAPVITSSLTASGNQGLPFTYAITATNTPTSYNATGLPAGLTINTTTGVISGTPTVMGSFNVTITATNAAGSDNQTLVITLGAGPCLNQSAFTSTPAGWSATSVTYASNEAIFGSNTGELATVVVSNPTSLTFDLRRTNNTSAKDLIIEVSTTTQGGAYNTVTTYNHGNTTSNSTTFCTVDLSAYTAFSNVYIKFRKSSSTTSPWYLQNVNVYCGPAIVPEIAIIGNALTIADGDITPSVLDDTDFGSELVGNTIVKTFTIENSGVDPLTLTGASPYVVISGANAADFSVSVIPSGTVSAVGTTTFEITFQPSALGLRTTTLSIDNNDADENPYNFNIQGQGITCTPTLSVSSISPTTGPVNTIVTINGSGFLTASTVRFGALNATFTIVSNTEIKATVPVSATSGNIVIKDTLGCDLSYSTFTVITDDKTTCDPAAVGITELFISEVTDASTGSLSYIEIFNGTASVIDMTDYEIYIRNNGSPTGDDIPLTGTLASGDSFTLATSVGSACGVAGGDGTLADQNDVSSGVNNNDCIHLAKLGTIIDTWGVCDGTSWINALGLGSAGYDFKRKATATPLPSTTFVSTDWDIIDFNSCSDDYSLIDSYEGIRTPPLTTSPAYAFNCGTNSVVLSVVGTEAVAGGSGLTYQWFVSAPGSAGWTSLTNAGVYSNVTTADMTISNLTGLEGYQYYCQVMEDTATCFVASNATIINVGGSSTTWNGLVWSNGAPISTSFATINGNYDTTANGNIECCSLLVNSTFTLNIQAATYVEIQYNLTVDGILNVLNNGSLVQVDDSGVNTGNISYERSTTGTALDYVYWSSPVNGVNTPATGFIFTWDPSFANPNTGWGYWLYARNTTMSAGVGYIMRDVFSRTFTGVPRNGVIQPTVSRANYTGADFTGTNGVTITKFDDNWNLIGNPYPSSISALDFLTMNTNIEGAVRLWTHDTSPSTAISDPFYANYVSNYTVNDYITHNGTGTVSGPAGFNGYIAGGQSFFVNMLDGSASTQPITFNNSLRNEGYDNSQFYRQAEPIRDLASQKSRIWLDIVDSNNASDRTLIGYVDGATYGNDRMFDAVTNVLSGMKIYSIIYNDRMTINGRSLPFENQDKVQLGVKTTSGGMFSIAISAVDGLFVNQTQDIFLEDKELNIIHNLRQSAYSFYMPTKGELNERFVLRYTDERLSVDEIAIIDNTVLVISGDVLEVISNKETLQEIVVYDVLGRKIFSKKNINSKNIELPQIQKSNNTLFVNITLENNSKIIKKVIF